MNTKSNKVTKLLSWMLVLTMMMTVVLPTSVFAIYPATVTTTLGDNSIIVDAETEFTVTTDPGSVSAMVLGKFEITAEESDITSLKYYATELGEWATLPVTVEGDKLVGSFGPAATGFPLIDATSEFKVTFAEVGDYDVRVSVVEFGTDNVIAYKDVTVTVEESGTISTDIIGKRILVNEAMEFGVSTVANGHAGTLVKGKLELVADAADIASLEYYETTPGVEGYHSFPTTVDGNKIVGEFGPTSGFPMMDATSKFRITFANEGTYTATVSVYDVASGDEICEQNVIVKAIIPGTVSTDLGSATLFTGDEVEYGVTTVANGDAGTMVKGRFEIEADASDIAMLEYFETSGVGEYKTLPTTVIGTKLVGEFGPLTGFPMMDATSKFKIKFANAGDYSAKIFVYNVENDEVLCEDEVSVSVINYADYTALDAAILNAEAFDANDYTSASYNVLKIAVDNAKAVNRKLPEAQQSTVNDLKNAIDVAIAGLVELADYSKLAVAYNAGSAITNDNGTYTVKTFKALTDALTEATKDENKDLTVQDDVDALTKAINDAIAGLVKNVEVTFTAVAVANDAKVDYAKANKIVLVFAEPVKDDANKLVSKLNIADKVSAANWTTDTVYTLTLKGDHGLSNNAEVAFDGDETIFTVSGNAMADTKANVIGNLTEAYQQVTATKMAATIVNNDDKPGADAGDKIVLVFNAPVKDNPDDIAVSGMTAEVVAGTYNTVYVITLDGTENVNDDTKLTFGTIANVELNGTFGTAVAPKALVAVAIDKDGTAKKTNDEIVVVFDRPTNGSEDISALSIFSDAEWNGANTELTLKVAGETGINSTIDISSMGIMDKDSIVAATNTSNLALLGSFGTVTAPAVLSMTAVDVDGTAKTEGDLVVIVFDRPTNHSTYISELNDFVNATWEANDTKLILEVGANALIANGAKLDISSMNIMDKDGIVDATNTEMTLAGSFGTVTAPVALRAYAVDNDGTELVYNKINNVEYKDQIVVVFDTPTNEASDISKINVVGTGYTASLGTKATLDWEENGTKLVITLGQDTVIKNGATIDLSDLGIMDKDNIIPAEATTLELDIEGSFGYSIQPRITKAVAFTQNDMDYIRVFFNTEVKAKAGETIDVAISGFTMGAGANKALVDQNNGLTYYEIAMAKDEHSSFESGRYAISLTGIVDKETGSKELASTPVTITGAFISPITPEVLKVVAISNDGSGVAKAGDKIVSVFNTEVKLGTVSASEGYLGTGYSVNYSSTAKNVVEIVLGDAGLNVVPGTTEITFSGFMDEATESVTMANTTKVVDGNFGYSAIPEIMSATAISADGSGIPKAGDKIVVVFNTMVTYGGSDIYYYEYTLTSDNEYNVGETFEITVVSKATGISYDLDKVIEGTFGYSVMPTVKSVVLSESEGKEVITVLFDRATNKPSFASNELNLIETNNAHLGDGIVAAWISDTVLKITLGTNASTKDTDKLNLSGLGIKAADTNADITGIDELAITGSLIPVATDVRFVGKKIQITFSARTNGVANISNLTALLGTGATADWDTYDKVLTITLGENYTITNNGYIVLNGMGIYGGFSGDYHVVGQYKVLGSIESDKLTVAKIVAQSTDKSKTTAQKGDTIVVKFNSATDLKGAALNQILAADKVDEIISIDGGNEAALGTGYTGEWTAYDTFVITLGGATTVTEGEGESATSTTTGNDPSITVGTTITVENVKFANGEGLMDAAPVELSGSFNGREFILTEGNITRTGANNTGDYRVAVKVEDTLLAPSIVPTVVCVAYNGTNPVSVMRISVDIENTIQPVFEFAEGLKITSAKVYVFNEIFGDVNSSPSVLAETLEIK